MPERMITKESANYRTNAMRRQCQACSMFRAPNDCTLVEGFISKFATCRFWESKKKGGETMTDVLLTIGFAGVGGLVLGATIPFPWSLLCSVAWGMLCWDMFLN